ncbi:MAG: type ISP restriction/modification enzyme [Patescibacteria group bacterium]
MSQIQDKTDVIRTYFQAVLQKHLSGYAMEHAYRPNLETLFTSLDPEIKPINDPKHSEHGAPDFVFLRRNLIMGYAEAKDIGVDLDKIEKSEQMKRYFGYSNLILTDYLEFRFYKDGERYGEIIRIGDVAGKQLTSKPEKFHLLADALVDFLRGKPEPITSGLRLAQIMGGKARRLRDNVMAYLDDPKDRDEELIRIFETVKKLLVHDLTSEKFADMYAQTLVYGLFVARYNDRTPENFSRQEARDLVPASNPFLREFFDHIAGSKFDQRLQFIVDELCAVFGVSDVHLLVQKHLRLFVTSDEKDPIIHFYEDFLKEYDPEIRKKMGAYYTPTPVVRYIVHQVDRILKEEFGLEKGLADTAKRDVMIQSQGMKPTKAQVHRVQILDPAVGTATFLNEIIKQVHLEFVNQEGIWPSYVKNDLLPRLHGFELMMAPYTIAHLKLGMTLQEMGVKDFTQRLGVYLTNTLEEGVKIDGTLFSLGLSDTIAKEAEAAGRIKHEKPIMVVIGNPPYSGVSSNETDYANNLIMKYKVEPGGLEKLKERKHWLNDDYVKFLAFAEEMVAKNGEGIVAMITNHGYLDNPTFRGMRWHLTQTFDSVHVLDLHGNAKKKEVAPDGGKDENVFNIQQGVAIIIAVKTGNKKKDKPAKVFHADLWGKRNVKFLRLNQDEVTWKEVGTDPVYWSFVNKNRQGSKEYDSFVSVSDLFNIKVTGIVTARDSVVIDFDEAELKSRMIRFAETSETDDQIRNWLFPGKKAGKYLPGDSRGWKLSDARKKLRGQNFTALIKQINYRPFDTRSIYYSPDMVDWGRFEIMQHFLKGENLGFVSARGTKNPLPDHFWISNHITEAKLGESSTQSYCFPLYLYHDDGSRTPNFNEAVLQRFTTNLKDKFQPENILDYIYAVLHSPSYREKYKEFLKIDFPRVPAPENDEQFRRMVGFGRELRGLHLLTSPKVNKFITTFPITGSNEVEKVEYRDGNVFINPTQYFGDVPQVAWEFYIGGYQPAQKWLKDRKGRVLNNEDLAHYQKIIVALTETARIMKEIDESAKNR